MRDITAQEFREAAAQAKRATSSVYDYVKWADLLLAAAEQREALDRTVASLRDVRERKDQRIVELVQQVAMLRAEP
jgi:hypothetical protein